MSLSPGLARRRLPWVDVGVGFSTLGPHAPSRVPTGALAGRIGLSPFPRVPLARLSSQFPYLDGRLPNWDYIDSVLGGCGVFLSIRCLFAQRSRARFSTRPICALISLQHFVTFWLPLRGQSSVLRLLRLNLLLSVGFPIARPLAFIFNNPKWSPPDYSSASRFCFPQPSPAPPTPPTLPRPHPRKNLPPASKARPNGSKKKPWLQDNADALRSIWVSANTPMATASRRMGKRRGPTLY